MILVNKDKKIMVGWTPKCACTTVCKMFFNHLGLLDEALDFHPFIHQYRQRVYEPKNPVLTNYFHDDSILKFKVVRNPYRRVVSSYVHYMRDSYTEKNHPIIAQLKQLGHKEPNNITFLDFLNYLTKVDLKKGKTEFHQEYQYDLFEIDNSLKWGYIIKIEHIKEGLRKINESYGLNLTVDGDIGESFHYTHKNKDFKGIAFDKRAKDIIVRNGDDTTIPDYKYFYNPSVKKRVEKIYGTDIKLYDYIYDL
jgi:hypothetical protein